ncbi:MAG: hypothetical protein H6Q90_3888 [Deltaproteobacteria bacterium]|nr:hypothetical protein [Deltaproteobacteria bacterium]
MKLALVTALVGCHARTAPSAPSHPPLVSACIFETAVATTILLAPAGERCDRGTAGPGVLEISLWQTRGPLPVARSWHVSPSTQAVVPPADIVGELSYDRSASSSSHEHVTFDLRVRGEVVRGRVAVTTFFAGD